MKLYLKYILLLVCLFVSSHADENIKKVVYDFTSGDIKVLEKKILSGISYHKAYYENDFVELEVSVVIHGDSYKFFIKDLEVTPYKNDFILKKKKIDFNKRLKSLSTIYDVEFLLCKTGLKHLKIDEKNIYPYVKIVATSTVALIDKQSEGYTYIPVFK